jgi:predicted transcriptional regulator
MARRKEQLNKSLKIAKVLKITQEHPNLTQKEVAIQAGVSPRSVARYLSSPQADLLREGIKKTLLETLTLASSNVQAQVKKEAETLANGKELDYKCISWQATKDLSSKMDVAIPKSEHISIKKDEKTGEEILADLLQQGKDVEGGEG